MARACFGRSTLVGAAMLLAPLTAHGQETGSDVMMPSPSNVVSSAALGLQAAVVAPSAQAFAAAVQAAVTQSLGDPLGETRARAELGNFRASILIKAGVLTFGGSAGSQRTATSDADAKKPAWAGRPIVFLSAASLAATTRR